MPEPEKPILSFEFVENGMIMRTPGGKATVLAFPFVGAEHILQSFWTKSGRYELILRPSKSVVGDFGHCAKKS